MACAAAWDGKRRFWSGTGTEILTVSAAYVPEWSPGTCGIPFKGWIFILNPGRNTGGLYPRPYQEILLDCGVLGEEGDGGLLYCRSVYLLTSFSEWQEGAFGSRNHWEERARQNGWHCLAAFGSEESRRNWNRRRKPFVDRIPFSADAFSVSAEDIRWIRNMLDQDFSR